MSVSRKIIFIILSTFLLPGLLYVIVPTRSSQAVVENPDLSNLQLYQTSPLKAVWGWADNTVIAAGYYSSTAGGYLIYRFNGSSWSESIAKLPNGDVVPNYGYISDLWGVSSDDVYAVTRGTYRDSYGGYYCGGSNILHYNGTNWQVVNNDSGYSGYTSIWGYASSHIYVTGLDCGVEPFVAHWNGTAWTSEDLTFGLNYEYSSNDIHGNASGDIYIAGDYGIPKLDTTAEYTNWPDAGPTQFGNQWQGIWVAPGGHVFAVAYGNIIAHYDGASWENMEVSQGESFNKVWGFASDDVYAVGYVLHNNDGTWSSEPVVRHFNGTSWSKLQLPSDIPSFQPHGVWGTKTGDIFVVGSRGVLSTATITGSDEETDYPLVKERCDAECGSKDPNSEWDGLSLGDCECKCKEDYHVELESVQSYKTPIASYNTYCASNDCRQLCEDMEWYEYKSGSVENGNCECSCVPGAERNMYGYCRPPDDLWTFLDGEDCGENTYPTDHDIAGTAAIVCTCEYGFANCDRHPYSGCETNIQIDKFNCGYCGNSCSGEQQCYTGSCVSKEFYDAVTSVTDVREQTEYEQMRNNKEMQEILTALQTNFLKNEFEFLWGATGDLLEAADNESNFFKLVSIYFDFFKKPSDHLQVQEEIQKELDAGNIDSKQAEMIKNLDAVLKASSVLSGFTGRGSMYQQGVLLDTATDMVIAEAVRSAKYSYCRDLITQLADSEIPSEQQAVKACLDRQQSAGVFK